VGQYGLLVPFTYLRENPQPFLKLSQGARKHELAPQQTGLGLKILRPRLMGGQGSKQTRAFWQTWEQRAIVPDQSAIEGALVTNSLGYGNACECLATPLVWLSTR